MLTILRDPLEMMASTYFYILRASENWKDQRRVPQGTLDEYLSNETLNMLGQFPRPVTEQNYRDIINDYFIDVGVTERLEGSLYRIASKLGKNFEAVDLPHTNSSPRSFKPSPHAVQAFKERHRLEYLVYDYVLNELN